MRKIIVLLALCILSPVLLAVPGQTADQYSMGEAESVEVNELFNAVNATVPSNVSVEENRAIIRQRIACFAQNFSYTKRAKLCMQQYQQDIVAAARSNVSGRPEIGLFIKNMTNCPIMYNLCAGQVDREHKTLDICVDFERQCIDRMLDTYWRGVPLYDNMQLRIE